MSAREEVLKEVVLDDLQEQHRDIAECISLESFLRLVERFGGSSIYIPQMREVVKLRVYRKISEEFDGTNIRALAVRYGVSESTVYNVVREQIQTGAYKHPQVPGQMSIVDMLDN